ncbi:MAG: polysaccharide deacetylase family protein [Candidatus Omnitrophica bacterium]|jgi:peptidoglycan/xylan/chitin deacetylase (PgdA/CDA1 family)|nr:polysaccharide deacetylase family protein [Candidatus Omnitrophota bacterium]
MRKFLITICVLFIFIGGLILGLGMFFKDKYAPVVLMYHMVYPQAESRYKAAIRDVTFAAQMRFLHKHQYKVVTLQALTELIKRKEKIPAKTIAITFDDGYNDNLHYAFPILKKYNFPVTIFIIVDEAGVNPQKLNWRQIKLMQDSGLVTFGSHCLGTEPLTNLQPFEQKRQIVESKRILENRLGAQVKFFSYPEGKFTAPIRQMVIDAGYAAAVATTPGVNYPNDDIFAIKRVRVSEVKFRDLSFAIKLTGLYNYIVESRKDKKQRKHAR